MGGGGRVRGGIGGPGRVHIEQTGMFEHWTRSLVIEIEIKRSQLYNGNQLLFKSNCHNTCV